MVVYSSVQYTTSESLILLFTQALTYYVWFDVTIININTILVDLSPTFYCLPKPLLVFGSMLLLSTLILSSYSIIVVMLGYDWGLRIGINITCLKYQEVVLYLQPLNILA